MNPDNSRPQTFNVGCVYFPVGDTPPVCFIDFEQLSHARTAMAPITPVEYFHINVDGCVVHTIAVASVRTLRYALGDINEIHPTVFAYQQRN